MGLKKNVEQKRKCIACGNLKFRSELIKITKDYSTGEIVVQPDSKVFGRSAYVCNNSECIKIAFAKNKIQKSLKINKDKLVGICLSDFLQQQ